LSAGSTGRLLESTATGHDAPQHPGIKGGGPVDLNR
jgi:hypothetical protein